MMTNFCQSTKRTEWHPGKTGNFFNINLKQFKTMKTTVFNESEKNLEMSLTILIPKKGWKPAGSDFDIDKFKSDNVGRMMDILGSFSDIIKASLERRMEACQQNLINHIQDVEFNDGRHIVYHRRDGSVGTFNVPTFQAMQDCVKALKESQFKSVLKNKLWVDQILKALLNDVEQHHEDQGRFKYSDLISMLCELHACPIESLNF